MKIEIQIIIQNQIFQEGIIELLFRGGYSIVWKVRDKNT